MAQRSDLVDSLADIGDWTPDELRRNGSAALDRLHAYFTGIRARPVRPPHLDPCAVLASFDEPLPENAQSFTTILDDTDSRVLEQSVLWNHPRHHAYFSNSSSGPAIIAELYAAALNSNVMAFDAAPAASAVERQTLRWVADLANITWPDPDAVLVDGASQASLYALAAAREHCSDYPFRTAGAAGGPTLRIYCSEHTHSSIDKAAITLGIGTDNVVRTVDRAGLLDPARLEDQILADRECGLEPMAVVATVGTTNTAAIEQVTAAAQIARQHGIWLHVDAAYGGLWHAASSVREHLPALDEADSVIVNPHKVLYCPMEVGALYCRRPGALVETFAVLPEYLKTAIDDPRLDLMNYTTQLGRAFRALKLWWVLRSFGRSGIAARLENTLAIADYARGRVADLDGDWILAADSVLPLLCIRPTAHTQDADNDALCRHVHRTLNARGISTVSHTTLDGRYVIRISFGNIATTPADVDTLIEELQHATETKGSPR